MNRHALILTGLLLAFTVMAAGAQWHPLSELRITDDLDLDGLDILNIGTLGSVDNTSTVDNLNADQLDGQDGSYYLDDTNAQTICSGSRALTGDGNCMNVGGSDGYLPDDPATSNVDMNGNQIDDVGTPSDGSDAATKGYVDSAVGGNDVYLGDGSGLNYYTDSAQDSCYTCPATATASVSCPAGETAIAYGKNTTRGQSFPQEPTIPADLTRRIQEGGWNTATATGSNSGWCADCRYYARVKVKIACLP